MLQMQYYFHFQFLNHLVMVLYINFIVLDVIYDGETEIEY